MFHVELAPLGGNFDPLKSDLGVFWPFRGTDFIMGKKTKCKFLKTLSWADFDLLESNSIYIFLHKNKIFYHRQYFFPWCMFRTHVNKALHQKKFNILWKLTGIYIYFKPTTTNFSFISFLAWPLHWTSNFFPWRICKHREYKELIKIETCSNCKVDDGGKKHGQW